MATSIRPALQAVWVALLAGLLGACGQDPEPVQPLADRAPEPTRAEKRAWDGAKVYDEVCDKCHKMGVDQAPILGDTEAWAPRIDKGEEILYRHVLDGFNEMPPRGDCEFCTDAQLRSAMRYMLANSRQDAAGAE
jgi:cytochrome c5